MRIETRPEHRYVAVIGGANIDLVGRSRAHLKMGDSNPGIVKVSAGGVARNVAENIARLGERARLFCAIGTDYYGEYLVRQCTGAGIDMSCALVCAEAHTSTYVSVVDADGTMKVAVSDTQLIDRLTPAYLRRYRSEIDASRAMVMDCNIPQESVGYLLSRGGKASIFVDTVSSTKAKKIRTHLRGIYGLKPTISEAEAIVGKSIRNVSDYARVSRWFHEAGVRQVYLSLGREGIFYSEGDEHGHVRLEDVEVRDVNGAGDALLAGIVRAQGDGASIRSSVRYGLACARMTLLYEGAVHPEMRRDKIEEQRGEI